MLTKRSIPIGLREDAASESFEEVDGLFGRVPNSSQRADHADAREEGYKYKGNFWPRWVHAFTLADVWTGCRER